jgi:hypothetical protein
MVCVCMCAVWLITLCARKHTSTLLASRWDIVVVGVTNRIAAYSLVERLTTDAVAMHWSNVISYVMIDNIVDTGIVKSA